MADVAKINQFTQSQLRARDRYEVTAVEAAEWLDREGLLRDSPERPGKPLRDLLRAGRIEGSYQEGGRFWYVRRTREQNGEPSPLAEQAAHGVDSEEAQPYATPDTDSRPSEGITVRSLLAHSNLDVHCSVRWNQPVPTGQAGLYIISMSADPAADEPVYPKIPISTERVSDWLQRVPSLQLRGRRPSAEEVEAELARFWLPDQNIIYIGKADVSLRQRVGAFYRTVLGDPKPHAGGSWIKSLSILDDLTVHCVVLGNPEPTERLLLHLFGIACSNTGSSRPMPFGNLETHQLRNERFTRIRRVHGLTDWKRS